LRGVQIIKVNKTDHNSTITFYNTSETVNNNRNYDYGALNVMTSWEGSRRQRSEDVSMLH